MRLCRIVAVATTVTLFLVRPVAATTIDGFAAMGASETAGTVNDYTGTWVPYVVNHRGLNFGGAGNPYNLAVGGATSATLLTQEQHIDAAGLVAAGDVDVVFLSIGGNDVTASIANSIANGSLSGQALTNWAQGVVNNITTAMDTVLAEDPLGMVVTGLGDITLLPKGRPLFDTPTEITRGMAATDLFNSLLKPAVLSRGGVFVDFTGALRAINDMPLVVGGVPIDVVNPSADPTHFFQDGVHPAAVGNGLIANLFLSAVNLGFETDYALLTDLEILNRAGLAASYTGETSNLPYTNFVDVPKIGDLNGDGWVDIFDVGIVSDHWDETGDPGVPGDVNRDGTVDIFDVGTISDHWMPQGATVPEPSTIVLLSLGGLGLLAGRRRDQCA